MITSDLDEDELILYTLDLYLWCFSSFQDASVISILDDAVTQHALATNVEVYITFENIKTGLLSSRERE